MTLTLTDTNFYLPHLIILYRNLTYCYFSLTLLYLAKLFSNVPTLLYLATLYLTLAYFNLHYFKLLTLLTLLRHTLLGTFWCLNLPRHCCCVFWPQNSWLCFAVTRVLSKVLPGILLASTWPVSRTTGAFGSGELATGNRTRASLNRFRRYFCILIYFLIGTVHWVSAYSFP